MKSGDLSARIKFSKMIDTSDDGYGNVQRGWDEQFTIFAKLKPRLGGEEVTAARLRGRNPVAVSVRSSKKSRQITSDWKAVDARSGEEYNIRSVVRSEDHSTIEMLLEKGVAV